MSRGYGFGKRKPVRKILRVIESILKSDFAEIEGNKMFLGKGDPHSISIEGVFGKLDTEIIKNCIKTGDIVVDLGANIGYYTLIAAKLVGDKGKVFAFEPEPKNFEILKKNVELNNYQNVILEQKAVSDVNEKINLYLSEGIGTHSIKLKQNIKQTIQVESIRLDDYFSNLNLTDKINFIKIDVEGAEFRALNGMNMILKQSKHLKIFTEFMKNFIVESGTEPKDMLELLINNGFNISYVDDEKNRLVPIDIEHLLNADDSKTNNILCERNL
ncbi:FkbM family methyltransferase [Candidatus Nitrosarchaeum limnium]|jgi:FkbM family methyltransferase|uniref:Methyltransferase, FkbM family n=1 Tax=Candidatus Nitrosarchaeum limnium BG20 TaxID=859192 RepID=S2EKI1_9ARCH|nr:FkbM family methyltransferase [Candidatus Nitrosarchaeum limnium]EPA05162.1 methyltransferase, FkbM family [Candidatus Nitrosarchaeum limnium BG20]